MNREIKLKFLSSPKFSLKLKNNTVRQMQKQEENLIIRKQLNFISIIDRRNQKKYMFVKYQVFISFSDLPDYFCCFYFLNFLPFFKYYTYIIYKAMLRGDPLDLLRSAYNKNLQKRTVIKLKGNDLYFDRQIKLPLNTETAWQSSSGKQYNLGSLWLYLQLHFQNIPNKSQYYKQVSELKLQTIGIQDAEQITKYFTGEINQTKCINHELKSSLNRNKGRDKPESANQDFDTVQKKIKAENKIDDETQHLFKCLEILNTFEKPVNSKSRCLKYPHKKFINILTHIMQNQSANQAKNAQNQHGKPRIASIYERKRLPIIIVPEQTVPGNVSIHNIQKFLLKGQYDQYAKLTNPDASKIQLQKQVRGKNILFEINCRPEYIIQSDWPNVVAIFVSGKDNQPQNWNPKNAKKVFENTLGYIVKFPKSHLGLASQWKIQTKQLDPISRIGDKELVKGIWQDIQNHLFARI